MLYIFLYFNYKNVNKTNKKRYLTTNSLLNIIFDNCNDIHNIDIYDVLSLLSSLIIIKQAKIYKQIKTILK